MMVQAGLIPEVKQVLASAGPDAQALKAIGYKELLPYLQGEQR
jgi:tRNA dimethylallyltransferase